MFVITLLVAGGADAMIDEAIPKCAKPGFDMGMKSGGALGGIGAAAYSTLLSTCPTLIPHLSTAAAATAAASAPAAAATVSMPGLILGGPLAPVAAMVTAGMIGGAMIGGAAGSMISCREIGVQNDSHVIVQYKKMQHPQGFVVETSDDGRYRPQMGYNHHVHPRPDDSFDYNIDMVSEPDPEPMMDLLRMKRMMQLMHMGMPNMMPMPPYRGLYPPWMTNMYYPSVYYQQPQHLPGQMMSSHGSPGHLHASSGTHSELTDDLPGLLSEDYDHKVTHHMEEGFVPIPNPVKQNETTTTTSAAADVALSVDTKRMRLPIMLTPSANRLNSKRWFPQQDTSWPSYRGDTMSMHFRSSPDFSSTRPDLNLYSLPPLMELHSLGRKMNKKMLRSYPYSAMTGSRNKRARSNQDTFNRIRTFLAGTEDSVKGQFTPLYRMSYNSYGSRRLDTGTDRTLSVSSQRSSTGDDDQGTSKGFRASVRDPTVIP